jgi:tetratricopeptide (TPR) repeat protein
MNLSSIASRLRAFCLTLGIACAVALSPVSATEPESPAQLPALKPLSKFKEPTRDAYLEVLSALYDQLARAESEESAELLETAIERFWSRSGSDTADILMERAAVALKSRNYPLATNLLTAITDIEPLYASARNQLATVYFLQEDYYSSMQQLRHVLALDPRNYKAIEGLSIILRETGKTQAALNAARRALAIHPFLKSLKQAELELSREVEGQEI